MDNLKTDVGKSD